MEQDDIKHSDTEAVAEGTEVTEGDGTGAETETTAEKTVTTGEETTPAEDKAEETEDKQGGPEDALPPPQDDDPPPPPPEEAQDEDVQEAPSEETPEDGAPGLEEEDQAPGDDTEEGGPGPGDQEETGAEDNVADNGAGAEDGEAGAEEPADEGQEEAEDAVPSSEDAVPSTEAAEPPADPVSPTTNGVADGEGHFHMSTSAEVADVDSLRQAVADVRSDASGVNRKSWLVVGHVDNNPNLVDVVGKDVGEAATLEDMLATLQDDQVMYVLVRLTTTVDMSATVKFVYIHWVGDQVPFVKRGRYGVVQGSIETYFNPYHCLLETGNPDDLSEEELIRVLEEKSMTANRIVQTPTDARHQRGFTQHQVPRSGPAQTPKAVAPSGNTVEVSPDVQATIGEIRQDSSPVTWLLACYGDNNVKSPLSLVAKGSGDIEELREELKTDHVMYGLLRTSDVYDEITTVKFVYLYWVGEDVKPMMKGKVYANAGSVESIFSPMHAALSISNVDELSREAIMDKVASGSGSKSFVMK